MNIKKMFVLLSCTLGLTMISILLSCAGGGPESFNNPVLSGYYPDPSVCQVDEGYYLVTSTFSYFPGIPVFHSQDLVNWTCIGHVLDRPETLPLEGLRVSQGLFAPAIRHHEGTFYLTCTLVGGGGNFIVTAKDPAGPWSDPVYLPEIKGIDPSPYFDEDGKVYIIYNSDAPDNKPLYSGHRTIRMVELDKNELKVISENKILINGGTDLSKKPIWIEGPHILKKDGFYYLIAAEGGTAEDHSQVVFRSEKVDGPYIPWKGNPILTQRHLDPEREWPVTCTGHADFIQTDNGDWWSFFLGCRPYNGKNFNMGRETFLTPVKWTDGWPVINPDFEQVQSQYPLPMSHKWKKSTPPYSGNFIHRYEFDENQLHPNWIFLRTPLEKWYTLSEMDGYLSLNVRPETCDELVNPTFIGHRQQHNYGSVMTSLKFEATSEKEKAGVLIFHKEFRYYFLCQSMEDDQPVIQLYQSKESGMELIESKPIKETDSVQLKIKASGDTYSFYYTDNGNTWQIIKEDVDAVFLSARAGFDFTGCIYALYTTSLGDPSENKAHYDWFEYMGNDPVYSTP